MSAPRRKASDRHAGRHCHRAAIPKHGAGGWLFEPDPCSSRPSSFLLGDRPLANVICWLQASGGQRRGPGAEFSDCCRLEGMRAHRGAAQRLTTQHSQQNRLDDTASIPLWITADRFGIDSGGNQARCTKIRSSDTPLDRTRYRIDVRTDCRNDRRWPHISRNRARIFALSHSLLRSTAAGLMPAACSAFRHEPKWRIAPLWSGLDTPLTASQFKGRPSRSRRRIA